MLKNSICRKRFCLGFVFITVLIATAYEGATVHLSALLLRSVVVGACLVLWPNQTSKVSRVLLIVPLFALLSVSWGFIQADNLGLAAQPFISVTILILLYVTLLLTSRHIISKVWAIACTVAAFHALWAVGQSIALSHQRATGGFFNPNNLAAFLVPCSIYCFGHLLQVSEKAQTHLKHSLIAQIRNPHAYIGFILLGGILTTESRSGLLALVIGMGCLIIGFRLRPRWWISILGLGAVGLLIALTGPRFLGHNDAYAFSRWQIWQQSLKLALTNPLGVGLNGYRDAMRFQGTPLDGWVSYPKIATQAHNEILHNWVEMGWLGLTASLLAIIFVIFLLKRLHYQQKNEQSNLRLSLHIGLFFSFAIPALIGATLRIQVIAFLAGIWVAQLSREINFNTRCLNLRPVHKKLSLVLCLALLGFASVAALGYSSMQYAAHLSDQQQNQRAFRYAQFAESLTPWSLGAALLVQSLRFKLGESPLLIGEALMDLAERFPKQPKPLQRAIQLLELTAKQQGITRDLSEAEYQLWSALIERDPFNAHYPVALGKRLYQAEKLQAASQHFKQALKIEPNYANALGYLALIAEQQNNMRLSQIYIKRAWNAHQHRHQYPEPTRRVLTLDAHLEKHFYLSKP